MPNALVVKLEKVASLSDDDRQAIVDACATTRSVASGDDIIGEGDSPDHVHLILEGWAMRYKILGNGSRQITAYLIPGDFCDLHVAILGAMDHNIGTLTRASVCYTPAPNSTR